MKFAELTAGRRISLGPLAVDEGEVLAFAGKYDSQWFHTDPERAADGPFQGLIASGWHTCAMAMSLIASEVLADSESFASPGLAYVRWPNPVRPGDSLTLELEVLEQRVSDSRPSLGIVRWQWMMKRQGGAVVLDLEATSMFRLGEEGRS
ncbi:MaoC family dehydratase [Noviherbaspirillum suwonense]|jgi:acyl dehydratase|uniref:Acyl dehydratase n=1 Tax=Noviherbaspirillum suwonense TaxID=1224511 RepID=A0ABY1PS21_9BURK|nr:MaoC family dehydratase [Noviherbaspirillum suwonense]SMP44165.1 Acyl dehydratase [Noviherbaspirillum suwonense]